MIIFFQFKKKTIKIFHIESWIVSSSFSLQWQDQESEEILTQNGIRRDKSRNLSLENSLNTSYVRLLQLIIFTISLFNTVCFCLRHAKLVESGIRTDAQTQRLVFLPQFLKIWPLRNPRITKVTIVVTFTHEENIYSC